MLKRQATVKRDAMLHRLALAMNTCKDKQFHRK